MSHRRHAGRVLVSIGLLAVAAVASAGPAGAATRTIKEFTIKSAGNQPGDMTLGIDGNVYFVDQATNKIGHITKGGLIGGILIPTAKSNPIGIATGSDGAIWFTEAAASKIGRLAGGKITQIVLPKGVSPRGITPGPDGNLYFVEAATHTVHKLTVSTRKVSPFVTLPAGSSPTRITSGPDGNLWVSETGTNKVARVTMGKAITQVALTGAAAPSRITSGNDGNVWVADPGTNRVTRITTAATPVKTNFPVAGHPTGIASAPDGNLYVTEQTGNMLARVTTAGVVSTFAVPTAGSKPAGVVAGADGNVWFSESHGNKIGFFPAAQGHSSWVTVYDGRFVPATQGIALATGTAKKPTTVRWLNDGGKSHNITDSSGMALFGSGWADSGHELLVHVHHGGPVRLRLDGQHRHAARPDHGDAAGAVVNGIEHRRHRGHVVSGGRHDQRPGEDPWRQLAFVTARNGCEHEHVRLHADRWARRLPVPGADRHPAVTPPAGRPRSASTV